MTKSIILAAVTMIANSIFSVHNCCYAQENPMALIIVDENMGIVPTEWRYAFELRRDAFVAVFADLFGIPPEDMDSMSLVEIIDVYGEPWQIDEISSIADSHYAKIASFTDSTARFSILVDSLRSFTSQGFIIDMMFVLHSNGSYILFYDGARYVTAIVESITTISAPVRALYQTCCYSCMAIPTWELCNISAVNGANEVNSYVLISPIWFLKVWTEGMPYDSAVYAAYQKEIDSLSCYETTFPEITYILSEEVRASSAQNIGGRLPGLLWTDFYSAIADFSRKPQDIALNVFPNPFNSSCAISVLGSGFSVLGTGEHRTPSTENRIEIFDLSGKCVWANNVGATRRVAQQKGDAAHRLYTWTPDKSIPSGVYLIKACTANGMEITKRVVYIR